MTGSADLAGVVADPLGAVSGTTLGAIAKTPDDLVTDGWTDLAGVAADLLGADSVASLGGIAKTPDDVVAVGRAVREGALR